MHVIDPVPRLLDEGRAIQDLVGEVTGVRVRPESRPVVDRFQGDNSLARPAALRSDPDTKAVSVKAALDRHGKACTGS